MRMCEPEHALDNVWHVLDVMEGSPAESAGLVPYGDWIVGWAGGALSAEGDFYDLVEAVSVCFEICVRNQVQAVCSNPNCSTKTSHYFFTFILMISSAFTISFLQLCSF